MLSLLLCAALLLGLAACGKSKKEDASFTMILSGNVSSLDPQTASGTAASTVIPMLYEGLCRVGADSKTAPGVAQRWEHNDSYTEFRFRLRDARWSDGSPVTAEDFAFGIRRALSPDTEADQLDELLLIRNAGAFHRGELGEESLGVIAEKDNLLVITLERPYPDFPLLTAGIRFMPCREDFFAGCAGHYGLSAEYVLGNGPFCFDSRYDWDTDYNERSLTLTRAQEYRGEQRVLPKTLTYLIDYDDAIDQNPVQALLDGTVDELFLSERLARRAEEEGCPVLALEDGVQGLLLNPDDEDLQLADMREIFLRSLDREDLIAIGATQRNLEAPGIMPACVLWEDGPYYGEGESCYLSQDDSVIQRIPSLTELLDIDRLPPITVLCPDDEAGIALANGILSCWNAKLGTSFNILPLPENELRARVAQGDYQAALYTLRAGGAEPMGVLKAFSSGASPRLMDNFSYDETLRGIDFSQASFRGAEELLRDQFIFYPLLGDQSYLVFSPGTAGVTVSPDGWIDFRSATK